MGKKGHSKDNKKKLTKKEKKKMNHLKLIHGKKDDSIVATCHQEGEKKKAA